MARARELLRPGSGESFTATNVSRDMRARGIDLFAAYRARVRIVYIEVPGARLFEQDRARDRVVSDSVVERLLGRWEVPDLTEAHALDVVVNGTLVPSPYAVTVRT